MEREGGVSVAVSKSFVRAEADILDVGTQVCLGKFPSPIRWFGVRGDHSASVEHLNLMVLFDSLYWCFLEGRFAGKSLHRRRRKLQFC